MILTDRDKPWWLWWAVGLGTGLILLVLDRPLIIAINPLTPIPWLDKFFNIYTDIGSWLVAIPCLLLVLSIVARLLRPRGVWGYPALSGLALLGIGFETLFIDRFRRLSTLAYVLMGWLGVIAIKEMLVILPPGGLILLAAGGVTYTAGVIFYVWRKLPYHHAIWHLFVIGGSVCHYFAILLYLL